jgi:hypothetical protein
MTVNVSKPAINVREKLAELDKPTGIAGEAMLRAETPQEQFNLIGAGRRRINHNGAMNVWQRGSSFSSVSSIAYHTDRYQSYISNTATGAATITKSTDAPSGFGSSYKLEVTTADTSLAIAAEYGLYHYLEGQDLQGIKKGTPDALPLTVSFWVKSSLTGKFVVELMDNDNSNRHCNKPYYVNVANTWEYKTITFPPDTTGVLGNDNGNSFHFNFWLGGGTNYSGSSLQENWGPLNQSARADGQTNVYGTNGATWQITGVQLEVGKVATPFEHRSYGEELALAQRFYYRIDSVYNSGNYQRFAVASIESATEAEGFFMHPVEMRAIPTLGFSAASDFHVYTANVVRAVSGLLLDQSSPTTAGVAITSTGMTAGSVGLLNADNNKDAFIEFNAEL